MEHFTKYSLNSTEAEILGKVFEIIHEMNPKGFKLCPVYSSQIPLQLSSDNEQNELHDIREQSELNENWKHPNINKSIKSQSINDLYGLYHHTFSGKPSPVIILCEGLMKNDFTKAKFDKIRTVVLLHEIGHWLAYAIPFNRLRRKSDLIRNPINYSKDTKFHEFWAQAFCFRVLCGQLDNHNDYYSSATAKYSDSCIDLMLELSESQSEKYKTFRTFQGANSLRLLASTPISRLFNNLHQVRAHRSDDFYHEFVKRL